MKSYRDLGPRSCRRVSLFQLLDSTSVCYTVIIVSSDICRRRLTLSRPCDECRCDIESVSPLFGLSHCWFSLYRTFVFTSSSPSCTFHLRTGILMMINSAGTPWSAELVLSILWSSVCGLCINFVLRTLQTLTTHCRSLVSIVRLLGFSRETVRPLFCTTLKTEKGVKTGHKKKIKQ